MFGCQLFYWMLRCWPQNNIFQWCQLLMRTETPVEKLWKFTYKKFCLKVWIFQTTYTVYCCSVCHNNHNCTLLIDIRYKNDLKENMYKINDIVNTLHIQKIGRICNHKCLLYLLTYLEASTCIICQTSNTYHDFPGLNISVL